jgi:hypothetical protein
MIFWRSVPALLILASLFGCGHNPNAAAVNAADAITAEKARADMAYLASDQLMGRNTPSPQLDTAAAYIARKFARAGLRPLGGSHLQQVKLNVVALGEKNGLRIRTGGKQASYEIKKDFVPFEMTASGEVRASLVFAGYGITAPEYSYDDYAGVDVRGKIVLVLRHEPGEDDTASIFKGRTLTSHANVDTKVRVAKEHGAVGVLVVNDPLNHTLLTPRGFPWPSLSKTIPHDALPITLGADESSKIPVVQVGESVIAQLFGSVDSLRAVQAAIDGAVTPRSFSLQGTEVWIQTSTRIKEMPANNVVGFLEGSDPLLKNQLVVVGAHYDHVGYVKGRPAGEDSIYNGADDNASGTVALLGVAYGLGALRDRPRRSILLIAFAGEEKGLFGSEYYARNPLVPLDSTVAMLNMDMVGRNSIDSLQLIGGASAPDLMRISVEENARVGFLLEDARLSFGGSDHMSFTKRKVPSLFYHSGLHPEYHKVTDEAQLINDEKVARTARLVFLVALRVASEPTPPRFVGQPGSLLP